MPFCEGAAELIWKRSVEGKRGQRGKEVDPNTILRGAKFPVGGEEKKESNQGPVGGRTPPEMKGGEQSPLA